MFISFGRLTIRWSFSLRLFGTLGPQDYKELVSLRVSRLGYLLSLLLVSSTSYSNGKKDNMNCLSNYFAIVSLLILVKWEKNVNSNLLVTHHLCGHLLIFILWDWENTKEPLSHVCFSTHFHQFWTLSGWCTHQPDLGLSTLAIARVILRRKQRPTNHCDDTSWRRFLLDRPATT